jgi:DnaJ-class molecular chaperone
MSSPFDILGIEENTAFFEVKKAYHSLSKIHHPDLNNGSQSSRDEFQKISDAYNKIKSDLKKNYEILGAEIENDIEEVKIKYYRKIDEVKNSFGQNPGQFKTEIDKLHKAFNYISKQIKDQQTINW